MAELRRSAISAMKEYGMKNIARAPFWAKNPRLTRVALVYRAGSRYEDIEQLGMSHAVRAGLGSGNLFLTKILGSCGNFSCSTTREHIVYSFDSAQVQMRCIPDLFDAASRSFVADDCDLAEIKRALKLDVATLKDSPNIQVLEAIHKAAYRNSGLGNSLYIAEHAIDCLTLDAIEEYLRPVLTSGNVNCFMTGIGSTAVNADDFARLDLADGPKLQPSPAKYGGGEIRIDTGNELVHAAVVSEGVSYNSEDKIALMLLQRAMGTEDRIKYQAPTSKLAKAAASASVAPTSVCSINATYSDSGLFGFYATANYTDAGKVLKSLMAEFAKATKGGITDADVKKAKAMLKVDMLNELESENALMEAKSLDIAEKGVWGDSAGGVEGREAANRMFVHMGRKVYSEDLRGVEQYLLSVGELAAVGEKGRGLDIKDVMDPKMIAELDSKNADYEHIESKIDQVTTEQVQAIAKKVLNTKPSMAVVGKLSHTPCLDELM